jgi:iron(III) transport system substrate-binding protein
MICRLSKHQKSSLALLTVLAAAVFAAPSFAQTLNVICPVQAEWCNAAAVAFEKETGIKVAMTLKGSGESFAQIAAEKANPKLDVWFGGTGDPHLQAAEQGLLEEYKSPLLSQLQPWAQKQAEQSKYRTVGMYLGALGIGYNTELLAKKKLAAPACWRDLVKPEFAGEVQMANPNASGTAYTAIATLVQVMGEEQAFAYLKALHKNINQYPRSGVAPIKAAARGETIASISFIHDAVTEAQAGFPVKGVAPCEGTGYEIGSLSIIKGARNLDAAKKFVDWALTAKAQALGAETKQFQIPSNVSAPISPLSPKMADIKLINYDFAKYGTSAERKRLLERWDKEVGSIAK